MRLRHTFLVLGSLSACIAWVVCDPDVGVIQNLPIGSQLVTWLLFLAKTVVYLSLAHLARKSFFDYLDLSSIIEKATETSQGAGLAMVGVSIFFLGISIIMFAATTT